jgi:gliding motility-associated lipoprotein GldH
MRKIIFILAGISLLLLSCDPRRVFDDTKTLPDNLWDRTNKVTFQVPISDTVSPNNMFINVRNSEGYPYSNLQLFVHTKFPDGHLHTDTLECQLADANGKWLGDGLGDLYDNQILFKRNFRFRQSGTYTFELEQAMRLEKLPLIMDIGIRIEKAKH